MTPICTSHRRKVGESRLHIACFEGKVPYDTVTPHFIAGMDFLDCLDISKRHVTMYLHHF